MCESCLAHQEFRDALKSLYEPSLENLSFSQLREVNVNRCEDVFHPVESWSPTDWATAMGGECGEALNYIKKLRRLDDETIYVDTPERRKQLTDEIAKEIADLIIYADLLAARLEIDLGKAVKDKFNQVSQERGSNFFL